MATGGDVSMADAEVEETLTAADVLKKLEVAWINETLAPDILEHQTEVLDCMFDQITEMENNLKRLKKGDVKAFIHNLELDRIRYMISNYLKVRLTKIESFCANILDNEKILVNSDKPPRLSAEETQFAKSYFAIMDAHLKRVAVSNMPLNMQSLSNIHTMSKPNLHSYVFVKANRSVQGVPMHQNDECDEFLDIEEGMKTVGEFQDRRTNYELLNEKKLQASENLYKDFETPELASKIVKLKHFHKFKDTTEALSAATAAVEGKMSKGLKKMLRKVIAKEAHEQLAVADAKLGNAIKNKLNLSCVTNSSIQELMRCLRSQRDSLITGLPAKEVAAMSLGLAHSLSRYKLKFSPDKVDTMIVQAVSLLDDLDKELNNYVMRTREWYGWHFPELGKIVADNFSFVKTVKTLGMRENASKCDLSEVLSEELEEKVKEAAEISMGTEISEEDIENILFLCDQVIDMTNYRSQLFEYLQNRMMAIAPNLTILVGELVGARLISHAGSLINLAKHPASTVQILGAEKALFRALKTKHDTPKYGLIYHAQLIGQCNAKLKGKMSRMLAGKTALASRVDALGEDTSHQLGIEHRAKLEMRLKEMEEGTVRRISGTGRQMARNEKYESKTEIRQYPTSADTTLLASGKRPLPAGEGPSGEQSKKKKMKAEVVSEAEEKSEGESKKKKKEVKPEVVSEPEEKPDGESKKKKKKVKAEVVTEPEEKSEGESKRAKKKKFKPEVASKPEEKLTETEPPAKKKKKKKRTAEEASPAKIKVKKTKPKESFSSDSSDEESEEEKQAKISMKTKKKKK